MPTANRRQNRAEIGGVRARRFYPDQDKTIYMALCARRSRRLRHPRARRSTRGSGAARWERWRPTVALCQHEDLRRRPARAAASAQDAPSSPRAVADDIAARLARDRGRALDRVRVRRPVGLRGGLRRAPRLRARLPVRPRREDYLVHITTGTHVAQICLFLLTESRYFPARLLQTSPPRARRRGDARARYAIIDLDLSRYDRLASRFQQGAGARAQSFLKSGIETRNAALQRAHRAHRAGGDRARARRSCSRARPAPASRSSRGASSS